MVWFSLRAREISNYFVYHKILSSNHLSFTYKKASQRRSLEFMASFGGGFWLKHHPGNGSSYSSCEGWIFGQQPSHLLHQSWMEFLRHWWLGMRRPAEIHVTAISDLRRLAVIVLAFVRRHQDGLILRASLHLTTNVIITWLASCSAYREEDG